jgi:hypothetical protein
MKVKDLPPDTSLKDVRVKIRNQQAHGLPPRAYFYLYSFTGFVTWVKTTNKSDRVYPIQMMSSQALELEIYKEKKKKKR